jgi:hypothetical protein
MAHPRGVGVGGWGAARMQPSPNPPNPKFKKHRFCRYYDTEVLPDFRFSQNQPQKSADDKYIRILKNKLIN